MKDKQGKMDETDSGDTSTAVGMIFHYMKIILFVGLIFVLFIIPAMRVLDSKVVLPEQLEGDLVMARLTNICFATEHDIFTEKKQGIIDINKVNKQTIENCFLEELELNIQEIRFFWKDSKAEELVFTLQEGKINEIQSTYIILQDKNGKLHPGRMELVR